MKTIFDRRGILILPDTDFEEEYLRETFDLQKRKETSVVLKFGASPVDLVGLRVEVENIEKE